MVTTAPEVLPMDERTHELRLRVNGSEETLQVAAHDRLLDVLRDRLGLTGTKQGCGDGVCGACTVLVDGQAQSACLLLALALQDRSVTTIEGVDADGELHPVQEAFLREGGLQCGFCTPGQIMAAIALLEAQPDPSPEEVGEAMSGNICRCTGYYKIISSVRSAAQAMQARR